MNNSTGDIDVWIFFPWPNPSAVGGDIYYYVIREYGLGYRNRLEQIYLFLHTHHDLLCASLLFCFFQRISTKTAPTHQTTSDLFFLVGDLPHLAESLSGLGEVVFELEDFDLSVEGDG